MSDSKNKEKKPYYMRIKNVYLRAVFSPFLVCFEHKVKFFIWVVFVVLASQLGTFFNLIIRVKFSGWACAQSLCADSASGNFYTIALVLITSLLPPLFSRFVDNEKEGFSHRMIDIVFTSLLIISMLFCAVFVMGSANNDIYDKFKNIEPGNIIIDGAQFAFFLLAIVFAWYAFGLSQLSHHPELGISDNQFYNKTEDRNVENISHTASKQTEDGNGIKI